MSETIEERVRRLEAFRYWALGRINAQNTLLADLWCNFIAASPGSVLATLERLRDQWLADAANPPAAPGLDPAYLELVSQEYRAALESLVEMMRQKLLAVHTTDPRINVNSQRRVSSHAASALSDTLGVGGRMQG